jgi:hypothetical protein
MFEELAHRPFLIEALHDVGVLRRQRRGLWELAQQPAIPSARTLRVLDGVVRHAEEPWEQRVPVWAYVAAPAPCFEEDDARQVLGN